MPNAAGGFFITDVKTDEECAVQSRKFSLLHNESKTRPETVTI